MLKRPLALAVLLGLTLPARADKVVAVAPLTTLGSEDTSSSSRELAAQLEREIAGLGGLKVVSASAVADAIKKAKKPALRSCEGEPACLAELGALVGAQIVIAGEVGGLGESKVVYLRATDVAAAKELRSTTLTVGPDDTTGGASGAVARLLAPDKYRGTLKFSIDVSGATIFVNGTKATASAKGEVPLAVGTQAVRVTHPEYRDFVRFIPVEYGKTTEVTVGMQQYPIIARDLQGKPLNKDQINYVDPPIYRRWYVVAGAAVGIAVIAAVVVGVLANDLPPVEQCYKIGGEDC